MSEGTIYNLPLHGVKIQEATEGVDILTDSFDANNYLQGFFRPPYKVLAEDTNISVPPDVTIMEYLNMDIAIIKGLVVIVEFPSGASNVANLDVTIETTLKCGETIFFYEKEPDYGHWNRPINVAPWDLGAIFITTLPMNAFDNAHFISIAEKSNINVTITNNGSTTVTANLKILGLYEQPANQISVFNVST